jgi:N-acetylglucosamine kinase-like BadF-type ATPase
MNKYVIGIDTGATKSHLALFDTIGEFVDFGHWGPLNYELLPGLFAQFEEEFKQFITRHLSKNGISIKQIAYAVLGIAGVDTKRQHGIISQIVRNLGFERFTLVNDAFLGIPAGTPAGTGICALNGTGCTLAGINKENKMLQIGGVGYISADYGGSGEMGQKVVSTVYSELFRRGRPTCMTPILLEKLGISNKHDFVDKVYEKIDDGSLSITACNKMLFEAALKNDELAIEILRDIAVSYANGISCMIEELEFYREDEIDLVFSGSVFVKSEHPILLDTIKEKIKIDNPNCRIKYTRLEVPPVAGAVVWALNTLGNKGAYYHKVCAQLQNI